MLNPCNTTVTIDGQQFDAFSTHFEVATQNDETGMPLMATTRTTIDISADIHDQANVPFGVLKDLFELSHSMTKDKIKDIKIEFWKDEARNDAICSFSFRGWISKFAITGGSGSNHLLSLSLQPALEAAQFVKFTVGN